eukprot:14768769-Alexandrium_andersonii.AAC.1
MERILHDRSIRLSLRVEAWIRSWRPDDRATRRLRSANPEIQWAALDHPASWASARSVSASVNATL